jgi:hypothetical protein
MKLESWHPSETKKLWKVVRRDNGEDVEGEIISADDEKGECCLAVDGQTKTLNFGPDGIKIVARGRFGDADFALAPSL